MNHLLNNIQGFVMGGYAGNHRMGITDTDVAVGAASGITTASAILQFNKVAVAPATITMGAAAKGSTSVSFPEWSKVTAGDVENDSAGGEGGESCCGADSGHNSQLFQCCCRAGRPLGYDRKNTDQHL